MTKILITATWCGPSYIMKRRLKEEKLKVTQLDYNDKGVRERIAPWNVRSLPKLAIVDDDDKLIKLVAGIDDIIKEIKNETDKPLQEDSDDTTTSSDE